MDGYSDSLRNLKKNIPIVCTLANIKKLDTIFLDYKFLVATLSEKYAPKKSYCENNFFQIKTILTAITEKNKSWRESKVHYKEACLYLGIEIDNILAKMDEEA